VARKRQVFSDKMDVAWFPSLADFATSLYLYTGTTHIGDAGFKRIVDAILGGKMGRKT
jgi:hypothetical protein